MGGSGSGFQGRRKQSVEESKVIAVRDFHTRRCTRVSGTFNWLGSDGGQSSVCYFVDFSGLRLLLVLYCPCGDDKYIRQPIELQCTPTDFGGERLWLTCPLIVGGAACNRRASKLYLPPGARYFGCRRCHELSYRSSQQAHQAERLDRWSHDLRFDAKIAALLSASRHERTR